MKWIPNTKIYFPQIGDSDAVIKQKKQARDTAVNAMKVAAGREGEKQESADLDKFKGAPEGYAERRARLLGGG